MEYPTLERLLYQIRSNMSIFGDLKCVVLLVQGFREWKRPHPLDSCMWVDREKQCHEGTRGYNCSNSNEGGESALSHCDRCGKDEGRGINVLDLVHFYGISLFTSSDRIWFWVLVVSANHILSVVTEWGDLHGFKYISRQPLTIMSHSCWL